jgi:outer membrane lipoprotein-sorting protein
MGIKKLKLLHILLGFSLLAGCDLHKSEVSNTTKPDEILSGFFAALHQNDYYQISVQVDNGDRSEYLVEHAPPGLIRTTTFSDNGKVSIYDGSETYVLNADEEKWYRLKLPKINPALEYVDVDVLELIRYNGLEQQLTYIEERPCAKLTCAIFAFTQANEQRLVLAIDPNSFRLMELEITEPGDEKIAMQYTYDVAEILLPERFEELSISDNPTREDLEAVEQIYGD